MEALKAFGVVFFPESESKIVVESPGARHWQSPNRMIDAGNSGTTARFLLGVGGALPGLEFTLSGDESLCLRPMSRVTSLLQEAGASYEYLSREGYLPVRVHGKQLRGVRIESKVASAQVKSALLFAALFAEGQTELKVPTSTRNHTELMMMALGAPLQVLPSGERGFEVLRFSGSWQLPCGEYEIPGDPSGLAFFAVMAFLHPGLTIKCKNVLANTGRTFFLEVLERAGLTVLRSPRRSLALGEDVFDLELKRTGDAKALQVLAEDAAKVIDEIPALSVAASACNGESRFEGLGELRVKESDRLQEVFNLLSKAGITVSLDHETLRVQGGTAVKGFIYGSNDHRMTMAAAILATTAKDSSTLTTKTAVAVSFPLFFDQLRQIYG
jgi:3-phosphoshikimate 1-carboxyvinyltransferase